MEHLWAIALYDLRLTTEEFYDLTPRQFSLLMDAHRKRLAHTEICHGNTTAAIINFAFASPKKPVEPSVFAPNLHIPETVQVEQYSDAELEAIDHQITLIAEALKQGKGIQNA